MRTVSPKRLSAPLSFEVTSSAVFKVLGGISWNVSGINSMRPKGNLSLLEEGQAAARTHAPQSTRLGRRAESPADRPGPGGRKPGARPPAPLRTDPAPGSQVLLLVELSWSVTRLLAPRAF